MKIRGNLAHLAAVLILADGDGEAKLRFSRIYKLTREEKKKR